MDGGGEPPEGSTSEAATRSSASASAAATAASTPAHGVGDRSLAPAWARLAIGAAVGTASAAIFGFQLSGPSALWKAAAGTALLGAGAALAADLDRPRPRLAIVPAIAAIYGVMGLAMWGLRQDGPYMVPLLIFPPLAARLRRGSGESFSNQYVSAQSAFLLGGVLALALAMLSARVLRAGPEIQVSAFLGGIGAAATASFMRLPRPLAALQEYVRSKARAARERDRPRREAEAREHAREVEARALRERADGLATAIETAPPAPPSTSTARPEDGETQALVLK